MKKLFLFAALAIGFAGCVKIKDLTKITQDIDYEETIDIPGVPGGSKIIPPGGISATYPANGFATNSTETLAKYDTKAENIENLTLTKLSLTMSQPDSQNLNFMDSVRVYISATGLEEKLAAYRYDIGKDQKTVNLDRSGDNFKDYFLRDSIFFRVAGHFVSIPDSNSKMKMNMTFTLVANPLE
jgi:hypothetical protein